MVCLIHYVVITNIYMHVFTIFTIHYQCIKDNWDFKNSNLNTFPLKLEELNLENLLSNTCSLDKCVHLFTKTFIDILKSYINNKTVTIRNRDKPWFHNEIRKQIRIRKRMHKSAKWSNSLDQWNSFKR